VLDVQKKKFHANKMNPLHLTESLLFVVISFLDFPSWAFLHIVAITTRLPYWREAFARGLRHLIARDLSRLLVGKRIKFLVTIRLLGRLYKEQYGSHVRDNCGNTIEQVIEENNYLFLFSSNKQSVAPAIYLNEPLRWKPEVRRLLIAHGYKRSRVSKKKPLQVDKEKKT